MQKFIIAVKNEYMNNMRYKLIRDLKVALRIQNFLLLLDVILNDHFKSIELRDLHQKSS